MLARRRHTQQRGAKKTKGGDLTDKEKAENRRVSRILIENINAKI